MKLTTRKFPIIDAIVKICFGFLMLFGLVGECHNPASPLPLIVIVVVATSWVAQRMLFEAIMAWHALWSSNKSNDDNSDDPGCPPPPALHV